MPPLIGISVPTERCGEVGARAVNAVCCRLLVLSYQILYVCTYILYIHISGFHSSSTPGVFFTYSYNHAHRLRLEKLFYIELSRTSNGYFKPLLDPGGGFTSETAAQRFQN